MPIQDFFQGLGVLPLRAIAFQCLLLLVAIALEAIILRQRLRIGYRPSVQYAATLNLFATVLGWLIFLIFEPLLPEPLQTQIISYVLFNRFYFNEWAGNLPIVIVFLGILSFFATLWLKMKGLDWLLKMLGLLPVDEPEVKKELSRQERYDLARRGRQVKGGTSVRTLAVLEANALSFTIILALILLRNFIEAV
ncbi:MAG TPA: filament integrity protein FraC [Leptolyngbyaceae cyanobacterium]